MTSPTFDLASRVREFRRLHESGCFVIPNPWDPGSASALERLGFRALATTSAGFAWSRGRRDGGISLEEALAHFGEIARAVRVPVNADFEGAFAVEPERVAENVARAAATGVAGLSVEDSTGDQAEPLFAFELALERIRAARAAIDASGRGVLLTARSEGFIRGRPDLTATLRRLRAFAESGADCLYAPGIRERADLEQVVRAVAPKPVNVLAWDGATVADLERIGARRISVGGSLARAAWTGFLAAAEEISQKGTFTSLAGAVSGAALNGRFAG
jgi:methylisocitrate lyase